MSTIPTTFNDEPPPYTVLGGQEILERTGVSAVLLQRGGRYIRRLLFQELQEAGFEQVVLLENSRASPELEELLHRFLFVRCILPQRELTLGEQINLAAREVKTPLFFVLWSDVHFSQNGGALRIAERWAHHYLVPRGEGEAGQGPLCLVPLVQNNRYEIIPTVMAPTFYKGRIHTIPVVPKKEGVPSLFPFDGIGVYNRDTFVSLGGYDGTIQNPYWQLMDFGFRAHLWGERILATQTIRIHYDQDPPTVHTTAQDSYLRFYLKNIAPQFRSDHAHLPYSRLFEFLVKSGKSLREGWELFREVRRWVSQYRYRFTMDARLLIKSWEEGV
ncbi:MAG TPA: hypothetical protein PLW34_03560 [Termitinemataceae bacterium]|nr:hypothetical protein [Termitinemataceae bacterium]HOM23855.1 hypothetical protein [Termitinemataceae bacterium]HPP99881.1 hypothetical protein [Termitinemataceae bacterium]